MAIGIASSIGASLDMRSVASVKNQKPKPNFMYYRATRMVLKGSEMVMSQHLKSNIISKKPSDSN